MGRQPRQQASLRPLPSEPKEDDPRETRCSTQPRTETPLLVRSPTRRSPTRETPSPPTPTSPRPPASSRQLTSQPRALPPFSQPPDREESPRAPDPRFRPPTGEPRCLAQPTSQPAACPPFHVPQFPAPKFSPLRDPHQEREPRSPSGSAHFTIRRRRRQPHASSRTPNRRPNSEIFGRDRLAKVKHHVATTSCHVKRRLEPLFRLPNRPC